MNSRHRLSLLTAAECAELQALAQRLPRETAATEKGISAYRQGTVAWLSRDTETEWLFGRIERFGFDYAARYGIDVDELYESLQFAAYRAGDAFDWHIDTGQTDTHRRKVTISVQLSSGHEYDGGDLEIIGEYGSIWRRSRGSAVAFASVLGHRVTRIESGTRYALVGWMHGPPYR